MPGVIRRVRESVPWGLIGAIVIAFAVEESVRKHVKSFARAAPMNWLYSAKAARSKARQSEVLCLGTSLIKFGLLPRAIEAKTGLRTFNLAVCNGHVPSSYFLLRRAIEAGARPKAILIDCQDGPVARGQIGERAEAVRVNLRHWPELLTLRDTLDLAWTARDKDFLAASLLSSVLSSYKDRFEIRASILAALQGQSASSSYETLVLYRNWNSNKGTQVMPRDMTFQGQRREPAVEPPSPVFLGDRWVRNRLTEIYTKRLLDLTARYHIRVFWLLPPLTPDQQSARDRLGLDQYFTQLARRVQSRCPSVVVIDARRSGYTNAAFFDIVHMNGHGASSFSAEVAEVVKHHLSSPPPRDLWVKLPPFQERPMGVPVEDIEKTRLALRLSSGTKR